jgi:HK97 family phage major capsid protein
MTSPQEELSEALFHYLHMEVGARPEGKVRWVMNQEWEMEVRRLTDGRGYPLWEPPPRVDDALLLMGYPIEVSERYGVPHLEEIEHLEAPND